jgi:hypothetical protein
MIGGGPLRAYELVDRAILAHSTVAAYRVNGGATVDYRIEVCQELKLLPGVLLIKRLHLGAHEHDAHLKQVAPNVVKGEIERRNGLVVEEYRLKTFVYF